MKHLYISLSLGLIRGSIIQYQDVRMLYMVLAALAARNKSDVVRGVKRSKLRELTGYSKDRISKCVKILRSSGLISTKKIGAGRLEYSFPLGFAPLRVPNGIEITDKTLVFVNIDTGIILNKKLPPTARLLQIVLHSFPAKNKSITLGMETLSGFLNLSRRSICRYIFTLKRTNNIRVQRRKYDYNKYFVGSFRGYGVGNGVGCGLRTEKPNKNKTIINSSARTKNKMPYYKVDIPDEYWLDESLKCFDRIV